MEISLKTKFNVGDTAFKYNPSTHKMEEYLVQSISIQVTNGQTFVGYHTKDSYSFTSEADLFASKEEFIAQL